MLCKGYRRDYSENPRQNDLRTINHVSKGL